MRRILICLLLLALLCGCTGQMLPAGKSKFTFYYRRADAQNDESYVSASGALAEKEVTLGGDVRTEDVLAAYFEEPDDETLRSLFPEGTACLGTKLQNGVLVLDMNEAYAALSGYERTLAAAGLTLTLTQLDGVDAVRIKTPAGALLDKPSTRWTEDTFLLQDTSWLYPERTVQLYFAGSNGSLQPEKRAISYQSPEELPQKYAAGAAGRTGKRAAAYAGSHRNTDSGYPDGVGALHGGSLGGILRLRYRPGNGGACSSQRGCDALCAERD